MMQHAVSHPSRPTPLMGIVRSPQIRLPGYAHTMGTPQYLMQMQTRSTRADSPPGGQARTCTPLAALADNATASDPTDPQGTVAAATPAPPAHACTICNQPFRSRQHLLQHGRYGHNRDRPHQCRYCIKSFAVKGNAKAHERTHTNEKPHKCRYCDKRFTHLSNVTVHERSHTGEKPHGCAMCSKRFTKSSDATRHQRCHTGERPFACNFCSKRFGESGTARRHERTHKGEMVAICALIGM